MRSMVLGEPGDEEDIVQGGFIPIFALTVSGWRWKGLGNCWFCVKRRVYIVIIWA